MNEQWAVIEIAPDYEVSTFGVVRNRFTGRIIKAQITRGYPTVNLQRDSNWFRKGVHQLIASAFVPGEAPGLVINHKDGNKENCNPYNLEWITQAENTQHAAQTGLIRKRRRWSAEEYEDHLRSN